jgi:hypothetical protein
MSRPVSWLRANRLGAGLGHRVGPKLCFSVLALSAASVGVLDTLLISGAGSYALGALDACATLACGVLAVRIGWLPTRQVPPNRADGAERYARAGPPGS